MEQFADDNGQGFVFRYTASGQSTVWAPGRWRPRINNAGQIINGENGLFTPGVGWELFDDLYV